MFFHISKQDSLTDHYDVMHILTESSVEFVMYVCPKSDIVAGVESVELTKNRKRESFMIDWTKLGFWS